MAGKRGLPSVGHGSAYSSQLGKIDSSGYLNRHVDRRVPWRWHPLGASPHDRADP